MEPLRCIPNKMFRIRGNPNRSFNSSRVISVQIYELSTYSTLEELVHGTCTHLRENPPLKEVSACGRRMLCDLIARKLHNIPLISHKCSIGLPSKGDLEFSHPLFHPTLVPPQKPLCSLWLKQFPAFLDPLLFYP